MWRRDSLPWIRHLFFHSLFWNCFFSYLTFYSPLSNYLHPSQPRQKGVSHLYKSLRRKLKDMWETQTQRSQMICSGLCQWQIEEYFMRTKSCISCAMNKLIWNNKNSCFISTKWRSEWLRVNAAYHKAILAKEIWTCSLHKACTFTFLLSPDYWARFTLTAAITHLLNKARCLQHSPSNFPEKDPP